MLVLEQRHIVGGPCAEYEYFPGYRASITNSPGSLEPKIVTDLELERFGLTFTRPNPVPDVPLPGRASLRGVARARSGRGADSGASPRRTSRATPALFEFFNRFAERLGACRSSKPPPTLAELTARLATPEDEEAFAKIFLGTVVDLLDEYLESEHLKAMVAMLGVMSNWLGPLSPGSSVWLMMRPMSLASSSVVAAHDPRRQVLRGSTGLPLGGMGSIVRTMRQSIEAAGGRVRTGARVVQILAGEDGASGVVLEDGEEIEASVVASNLGPWTTFLDLVEARHLDSDFRATVERLPKRGSAFKVALALDALPRFAASPKGMEEACSGCQFRIAPSIEYQERAFDDAKYGRWSRESRCSGASSPQSPIPRSPRPESTS